jgi:predicted 2-oxoglutarate/Fe(II)-dependent dioxygenase YbiX
MSILNASASGIFEVDLLTPAQCQRIIEFAENGSPWRGARISVARGQDAKSERSLEHRSADVKDFGPESEIWKTLQNAITGKAFSVVKQVWPLADANQLSTAQLNRYQVGGFFSQHTDTGITYSNRYVTVLCYVNDAFSGGETVFPRLAYTHKPCQGHAIVFPSEYLHAANPVLHGTKYSVAMWLLGSPQIDWIS